ncbi:hypothetical protein [Thalassospira xiamenensis]|uniref:Uncharacterized protein n=1 Tax=Thalassospira xiamenensis TaxID=220697 RepID=A0A285TR76_9PROT|nr:hypothetical protein [Thalassospira xiamenensis]SOC25881.1 hypothetical protein SAMN05428964_1056 [Thalassospira xiamenensis]
MSISKLSACLIPPGKSVGEALIVAVALSISAAMFAWMVVVASTSLYSAENTEVWQADVAQPLRIESLKSDDLFVSYFSEEYLRCNSGSGVRTKHGVCLAMLKKLAQQHNLPNAYSTFADIVSPLNAAYVANPDRFLLPRLF